MLKRWYYKFKQLRMKHILLTKDTPYNWSFFTLIWRLYIIGIYEFLTGTDNGLVFCIMIIKKESNSILRIIHMRFSPDFVKKDIPYWFNLKMQEYASLNYKYIMVNINSTDEKNIELFTEILEFDENRFNSLESILDSKSNELQLIRKLRENAKVKLY